MELENKLKERQRIKNSLKSKASSNKNVLFNKAKSFLLNTTLKIMLKTPIVSSIISKDVTKLNMKRYTVSSNKLSKNYKILFISDLHFEVWNNNNEIKSLLKNSFYDFIVLGGDYFDKGDSFCESKNLVIDFFDILDGHTQKIYSVAGNHDDTEVLRYMSERSNLLLDETVSYNQDMQICGLEESVVFKNVKKSKESLGIADNGFIIGVSHNPLDENDFNFDLMLSGHTHGGQVTLLGHALINNCKNKNQIYGKWTLSNGVGITTSGVGCSGVPVRHGIKPELVEIELKKEDV